MLRELFEIDFFISMTEIYILIVFQLLLMAGQMAG